MARQMESELMLAGDKSPWRAQQLRAWRQAAYGSDYRANSPLARDLLQAAAHLEAAWKKIGRLQRLQREGK